MSELENNWKPRKAIILDCPSGSKCEVQKPGPELGLKVAHLQRRLKALRAVSGANPLPENATPEQKEEASLRAIESMTDEQKAVSLEVMRITVVCCVKRPRLYLNPKPGQLGVDDIDEADFYHINQWYQDGCKDPTAETDPSAETEVTAAEVDKFPVEPVGGSGAGDSGGDVRAEAERVDEAA